MYKMHYKKNRDDEMISLDSNLLSLESGSIGPTSPPCKSSFYNQSGDT